MSWEESIVLVPADKGRATVIMDREEYTQKMKLILNDADKYQIIKWDPTLKLERKITESLKHLRNPLHPRIMRTRPSTSLMTTFVTL